MTKQWSLQLSLKMLDFWYLMHHHYSVFTALLVSVWKALISWINVSDRRRNLTAVCNLNIIIVATTHVCELLYSIYFTLLLSFIVNKNTNQSLLIIWFLFQHHLQVLLCLHIPRQTFVGNSSSHHCCVQNQVCYTQWNNFLKYKNLNLANTV